MTKINLYIAVFALAAFASIDQGWSNSDCAECRLHQIEKGVLPMTDKDSNATDLDQTARRIERSIQSVRTIHDQNGNPNLSQEGRGFAPKVDAHARPMGRHPSVIEEL